MRKVLLLWLLLAVACLLVWWGQTAYDTAMHKPESPVLLFASVDSGVNGSWLQLRADYTFAFTRALLLGDDAVTHGRYHRRDSVVQLDRLPPQGLLRSPLLLIRYNAQHRPTSVWQLTRQGQVDSSLAVFTVYEIETN